ncbi:hypothetical protein DM860_014463 [Cuscuta australis]|uniref:DUF4283 domain-containing protein n=1 Tax=Cuscuta australis TaxID=267555 RepID=A0A328E256_9ASTE|nr:hypothetical protein DM860_014463 [Cuscuta australis]
MLSTTASGVTGRPPAIIDTPGCSHLDQPAKTFLQALNGQHCAAPIIPEEVKVEKYKGLPCVAFTIDEVNQLSARFSRALVGTFYYGRPSLQFIRLCLERIGFMAFTVALIDTNHILINFSSDNDYHRCFKRHDWKIGSYSMRISKWTPDFDPRYESPILPLWIAIKDLPIHLHSRSSLLRIGNVFGKAIKIDTTTKNFGRPSTARVCVEVDISKPLPTKFYIKNGETPVLLTPMFEDLPEYCNECRGVGRHSKECKSFIPTHHQQPKTLPLTKEHQKNRPPKTQILVKTSLKIPPPKHQQQQYKKVLPKPADRDSEKGPISSHLLSTSNTFSLLQEDPSTSNPPNNTTKDPTLQNIPTKPSVPSPTLSPTNKSIPSNPLQDPQSSVPKNTQLISDLVDQDWEIIFHDHIYSKCLLSWEEHQTPKTSPVPHTKHWSLDELHLQEKHPSQNPSYLSDSEIPQKTKTLPTLDELHLQAKTPNYLSDSELPQEPPDIVPLPTAESPEKTTQQSNPSLDQKNAMEVDASFNTVHRK